MQITKEMRDEVYEYLKLWKDQENWSDYEVIYSMATIVPDGLEYLCDFICSTGCIDSKACYTEFSKVQSAIEKLAKRYRKLPQKDHARIHSRIFENCFVAECEKCNHISFLKDSNEELYPEVKVECWSCKSKDIKTSWMFKTDKKA